MKKLKVITVVGTRPEIIRLSATIRKLDLSDAIDHVLIHTGQNYDFELNDIFFRDLNIRKPDYFLNAALDTPMETIGTILIRIDPILDKEKPDALLVLGDTNSCLTVLAAKRRQIPIFHMEAGNRCFDQRVPEETNRKIVDHIADINLPYSKIARDYLLREGIPSDRIIKTGSPMYEVIMNNKNAIDKSDVLERLGLKSENFFLVSAHREENINTSNFLDLIESLNVIAERYQLPIIFSTHPRTRKMLDSRNIQFHPLVQTMKPLGFIDYNKLQIESKCVLSDSGTISEEASILGFRALNIREAHERPEAMEEAVVMMVGLKSERILQALAFIERMGKKPNAVDDYTSDQVSDKILKIIISYTDYVNRVVWKKYDSCTN